MLFLVTLTQPRRVIEVILIDSYDPRIEAEVKHMI